MTITVRKPKYTFDKNVGSFWYADNKFATSLFSALSATFPLGERFFITAVRDNMDAVKDEALISDVSAFSQQEGQHSKKHMEFNDWLDYKGFKAKELEDAVRIALSAISKLPKKHRLAITCALEHITASLADRLIDEADVYASKIDPVFREFWQWHALEESEHKAVAMDVYIANDYDEGTRILVMLITSVALTAAIIGGHAWTYWSHPGKRGVVDLVRGAYHLYGHKGFVTKCLPAYFMYYRPFFHPNDRDAEIK